MIDIAKNIIEVGDKVTTFYCDISGGDLNRTVLRTGLVVAISPDESKRYDWAEIQIPIKLMNEEFHVYVHRRGNQILKK